MNSVYKHVPVDDAFNSIVDHRERVLREFGVEDVIAFNSIVDHHGYLCIDIRRIFILYFQFYSRSS